MRLKADGNTGKVGIYSGNDDNPLTNPLGHLNRLKFHSDLNYPSIIDVRTGSTTFIARGIQVYFSTTHALFTHGQPGFPLVFGRITNLLGSPPLNGSVPIQINAWGFGRWIHLGADSFVVLLNEILACGEGFKDDPRDPESFKALNNFPAISISWEVYVTDTLL